MNSDPSDVRGIDLASLRDNAHLRDSRSMTKVIELAITLHRELCASTTLLAEAGATDAIALLRDDAYAMTFQTMGQYRTALIKALSAK